MLVLLFFFIWLARILPPASFYKGNEAFNLVFKNSMRIIVASLSAFFISELLDIAIFSKIKEKLRRFLWLRSNVSNIISQLIDTTVFIFIAFYLAQPGYDIGKMFSLIFPYWGLKILFSVVETPLTYIGVYWLKRSQPHEPEQLQKSPEVS